MPSREVIQTTSYSQNYTCSDDCVLDAGLAHGVTGVDSAAFLGEKDFKERDQSILLEVPAKSKSDSLVVSPSLF